MEAQIRQLQAENALLRQKLSIFQKKPSGPASPADIQVSLSGSMEEASSEGSRYLQSLR
jgi:hypothetical protein